MAIAAKQILNLSELIHIHTPEETIASDLREWKKETKAGLRAIVQKDICENYESILRMRNPANPAKQFLVNLSSTLSISHLL